MGSKSNYFENAILDHALGGPNYSRPATVYIALCTTLPTDASTGSTLVEVTNGSYARVAVTNNDTNFPAAASGAKSNGVDITFPQATADYNADVVGFAIVDAATLGNILYWGALAAPKTVQENDIFKFLAGDLDISED